jgi:hypothetical protein
MARDLPMLDYVASLRSFGDLDDGGARRAAGFANFDDFYQIDPDLSIKKCE